MPISLLATCLPWQRAIIHVLLYDQPQEQDQVRALIISVPGHSESGDTPQSFNALGQRTGYTDGAGGGNDQCLFSTITSEYTARFRFAKEPFPAGPHLAYTVRYPFQNIKSVNDDPVYFII